MVSASQHQQNFNNDVSWTDSPRSNYLGVEGIFSQRTQAKTHRSKALRYLQYFLLVLHVVTCLLIQAIKEILMLEISFNMNVSTCSASINFYLFLKWSLSFVSLFLFLALLRSLPIAFLSLQQTRSSHLLRILLSSSFLCVLK